MSTLLRAAALAGVAAFAANTAFAHAISGVRVFPVTLTMDDPGVADEATLPQFVFQPEPGSSLSQWQWEFDKTITPNTALIYNHGYDILRQAGTKTATGFENAVITGKWQAWVVPEHEFLLSLGVQRELPGSAATVNIGGDTYGATSPTVYFGKGLGDLPIGNFRPLAITGELNYTFPDRVLNAAGDNNGSPRSMTGSFSVQYSIPYLDSQVQDHGLPDFLGRLVPLVETSWNSPMSKNPGGPMTLQVAAGAIYLADTYQIGVEAIIPANKAAGANVGVIAQVHLFFDDIFPNSLGKPLFQ